MGHAQPVNLRTYWITWAILLAITAAMLLLEGAAISRTPFLILMIGAMTVKASLIAGTFMHLRFEKIGIVLTVVVGLFVFGLVLYALMAPDAIRIREMADRPW
jgi:cytochrome c oxidase subunit IV